MQTEYQIIEQDRHEDRVFVNPGIGCTYQCKYCYLPQVEISNKTFSKLFTEEEVFDAINNSKSTIDTIYSFGCFTEAFHNSLKERTVKIIRYLLDNSKWVQVSTKATLTDLELQKLGDNTSRLDINISIPYPADIRTTEPLATSLHEREEFIDRLVSSGFHVNLYVKPYTGLLNEKNLLEICRIAKKSTLPIILGRKFTQDGAGKRSPFSHIIDLHEDIRDEFDGIFSKISQSNKVYFNSTESLKERRNAGH